MRRGRQSAFWLHLLRCFPTAEQLSPATSDQPSALKGQALQLGSPSQPVARFGGRGECLAIPSLSLISNLARLPHVCSGTWIGETGVQHFFFFSTESKAENDINVSLQSPAVPLLTGDDCSHLAESWHWKWELQREISLFEATDFSEFVNGM